MISKIELLNALPFYSLLRDVPFSAIYFTAYAHLKKDIFREGENGKTLSFMQTLTAAGIAGALTLFKLDDILSQSTTCANARPFHAHQACQPLISQHRQTSSRHVCRVKPRKATQRTRVMLMHLRRFWQKKDPELCSRVVLLVYCEARRNSV